MKFDLVLKCFESPDEVREMPRGRFEVVRLGALSIGRATYQPGWRWSEDVGKATGAAFCEVEHVGLVLTGSATVAWRDGKIDVLSAGDLFQIAPGHDSWVLGDAPYVSLHFAGTDAYARKGDEA